DFFVSSRRRHTRSKRDWSSDVCSSDLRGLPLANATRKSDMVGAEGEAIRQRAFTGRLPSDGFIDATLGDIHRRYRGLDDGEVADYIPNLAEADPDWFGLSLIESVGTVHETGDTEIAFSIQSISKAFVFALVCQERSTELVHERVGVNNTGLPFNSVMAIELNDG